MNIVFWRATQFNPHKYKHIDRPDPDKRTHIQPSADSYTEEKHLVLQLLPTIISRTYKPSGNE